MTRAVYALHHGYGEEDGVAAKQSLDHHTDAAFVLDKPGHYQDKDEGQHDA